MLLAFIESAVFARGIMLSRPPIFRRMNSYRNGLQRARFPPAIDAIKQHW